MSADVSVSERVVELAEEFLERCRRGERPSVHEYVTRYPELAADIRQVFPAMAMMERVAFADDSLAGPPAAPASAPPPLRQLGDFRILREIGRGGMGVVYEAEQVSLGRYVALKVLTNRTTADAQQKMRFEREARAAARLHHTNIVPVFGFGEYDGTPYYVMQFIRGQGLDLVIEELAHQGGGGAAITGSPTVERVASLVHSLVTNQFEPKEEPESGDLTRVSPDSGTPPPGPAAVDTAVVRQTAVITQSGVQHLTAARTAARGTLWRSIARLGVQAATALEHAHQQGVLHRDIKPANLLLDVHGTLWVTDFGLAKADGQPELTRTGDLLGTLRYMPPEAFDGRSDARGDVYALGLTLYELLAHRPAFPEADRGKLIKQVTAADPDRLSKLVPGVPKDLATIVHKAVRREPDARYQSAAALADDLQRFLDDRPISARPISAVEHAVRVCRRNPLASGLAAALLVAVAGGAIGSGVGWNQAVANEQLAKGNEAQAKRNADAARDERDEVTKLKERVADRLYLADMTRANALLDGGEVRRCKEVLARHQPNAAEADARDRRQLEWYYLKWAANASARVIEVDKDLVSWRAISPDGALAIAEVKDGYQVWDLKTGKKLSTLPVEKRLLKYAAFHPTEPLVVTVDQPVPTAPGFGGSVRVWPVREGADKPDRVIDVPAPPNELTFSPDGKRLFVGLMKPRTAIRVFDTATWEVADNLIGLPEQPYALVVSRDGRMLASGMADLTVRLTPLGGKGPVRVLQGVTGVSRDVLFQPGDFSPDGTRLLTANWEAVFRVWDVSGPVPHPVNTRSWRVSAAKYSPSGDSIAVATRDGLLRLVDPNTLEEKLQLRGHTEVVAQLSFDPTGRWLTTCGVDRTVRVWDLAFPGGYRLLDGHREGVMGVALSPDGKTAVGVGENNDGSLRVWDADTGTKKSVLTGHPGGGRKVRFSPDGKTVASCGNDGVVKLWDATTWAGKPLWEAEVLPRAVRRVASLEGLAAASGVAAMLDESARRPYWIGVSDVQFTPDGTRVICCTWSPPLTPVSKGIPKPVGPKVQMLDAKTGRAVKEWGMEPGHGFYQVAFTPDATRVVARVWNGDNKPESVLVWDVTADQPKELYHLRPPGSRSGELHLSIAVHPNRKELAVGFREEKIVRFYDLATGKELDKRLSGPAVGQVTYTNDGSRVITAADSLAHVWDAASGDEVLCLRGHTGLITGIAVTPAGDRIATSSVDRTVRIWDAPRGK